MSFFKSEVVRAEMAEIEELQEDLRDSIFKFAHMSKDEKIVHMELLEKLLNKQQILYTRLSLSDDPEAKEMKKRIMESAQMMGLPENIDMNVIFGNLTKILAKMREQIDIS